MLTSVPDVPVIVIAYLPAGTAAPTVIVHTLVLVSGFGTKVRVTPTGAPEYVNVGVGVPSNCVRLIFVGLTLGATTTIGATTCNDKSTVLPK